MLSEKQFYVKKCLTTSNSLLYLVGAKTVRYYEMGERDIKNVCFGFSIWQAAYVHIRCTVGRWSL